MKICPFGDVSGEVWDGWVTQLPNSTYLHSSRYLTYLHAMHVPEEILTFAVLENIHTPLALCPLGLHQQTIGGVSFVEGSWGGAPVGAPALAEGSPRATRNLQAEVFGYFHDQLRQRGGRRCLLQRHPISLQVLAGGDPAESALALLCEGYEPQPQNNSIVNLTLAEAELETRLSKYHRRQIHRSERDGLKVTIHGPEEAERTTALFAQYQAAHFQSAGRLTRPQRSFDLMCQYLLDGTARLFVAWVGEVPISFLYCGEFATFAYGWSQANLKDYEHEHSPRQLLEWEALSHYRQRGFKCYELGTIWHGPQFYKVPTPKELSIAEFKRRFGGTWYPDWQFEKILDQELWAHLHQLRLQEFLASDYFRAPSAAGNAEAASTE